MHVADQLLRDGARAAPVAHDVVLYRASDADEIDAVVLIEALILDRHEGLTDVLRECANRDAGAQLFADLAHQRSVVRENERRLRQRVDAPRIGRTALGARAQHRRRKEQERAGQGDPPCGKGHAFEDNPALVHFASYVLAARCVSFIRMGSNTNPPESVGSALVAIRRLVRTLRTTAVSVERETGLSTAQTFVLQLLLEAPAESMNDLAARTSTDQSSVSVVVSRLEAKGLVSRLSSAADARRTQVVITAEGAALMHRKPPTVQERLTRALSAMPAGSLGQLSSELNSLVSLMGADEEPATLIFEDDASGSS